MSTKTPHDRVHALEAEMARLAAEADALREQLELTEHALSAANIGLSFRDSESNTLRLSRSLVELIGLPEGTTSISRDELLARMHPDDAPRVEAAVRMAMAEGSEFALEYRMHAGPRGWRWFRSNGRVTTTAAGRQRIFSAIADITDWRTLEAQLQHAQKMDAIGQLAGGVAHDFNNVLTAIGGYSQLLLESARESQRNDLQEIIRATDRAAALTRQLLAFSSRQVVQTAPLDLNVLVGDMVSMLRRIIGEHVTLTTDLAPGLPAIRGDKPQFEQVVMNLVVNAKDALGAGGTIHIATALTELTALAVEARPAAAPGRYVTLTVSDTGQGMDDETKAHLFEPFFTTKLHGQGTGLGLATVYGIVTQSGGSVAVSSEPGIGSTFTIYLPPTSAPAAGQVVTFVEPARGGVETVLLVEDEDAVRVLARRILQRAGYTVVDVASAADAETRAETMPAIDLLLTDVVMPGCTGPELYRRLIATHPGVPVLFMSGYAERDLFEHATLDAKVPFLAKPFTVESLLAKVRAVIDG